MGQIAALDSLSSLKHIVNLFDFGHCGKKWIIYQINIQSNSLFILVEILMSKPESIKIDPWTDFPSQPYSIIGDNFVHSKLFTFKVNSKGEKSTFNVKVNASHEKGSTSLTDQVKFWFSLPGGRSLYSKVKSSNYIKVHYDNGTIDKWDKKWNLYASLNANKALENLSLRLGAAHKSEHCHSDNRLRIDFNAENKKNLTWYNRTIVTKEKFTFGLLGAYGLTNNVLVKNNFLFGYKINDDASVFLRLENKGYRKDVFNWADWKGYFDNAKVDFVNKYKDIKYGIEGVLTHKTGCPCEQAMVVVQHNNKEKKWVSKAKISTNFDVSLSFKYPCFILKDIANVTLGLHGSKLQSERREFKYGIQIDCNV